MKILHITDSHASVKPPRSRRDVYYYSFLKKMYELKKIIGFENIDMVIHTGDLFHTPRVSDKFAGQVSQMIKSWGIPMFVVPGNHDIDGYSISTLDQTKLGLLEKAGVIQILCRDTPFSVSLKNSKDDSITVGISGQEYYPDIDSGNMDDFKVDTDCDLNILAIHGYLCTDRQHPDIRCTYCENILTDADIILSGHYHHSFKYDGADFSVYNPGSMMRIEQDEYNKTKIPQYGILEITLDDDGVINYEYGMHDFRIAEPSDVVFDYDAKYAARSSYINLDNFKEKLSQVKMTSTGTTDINAIFMEIKNDNLDLFASDSEAVQVLQEIQKYYNLALQSSDDVFGAPQGYIEGNPVYIKSVDIKNFQSHKDTHIDFDMGMNIFTGESNNGKTSVFRAITWCLFNSPSGNAFIMGGKKDCSVRVTFSDNTYIERSRTLKDSGQCDIMGTDGKIITFKGIGNALPIDVANIHRMPEVQVTKSLSTHLNIMYQFDKPFLISDSPTEKAAAIGRITGVQNIDSAIKTVKNDIRQDKAALKKYEEEKSDIEKNISSLPDIDKMKSVEVMLCALTKYSSLLNDTLEQLSEKKKKIEAIDISIASVKSDIKKYEKVRDISPCVNVIYERFKATKALKEKRAELKDTERNIVSCGNEIATLENVSELNIIASSSSMLLSQIKTLSIKKKAIEDCNIKTEAEIKKQENIFKAYTYIKGLEKYLKMEISNYCKLTNKYQALKNIDSSIASEQERYDILNYNLEKVYKKKLSSVQNEYMSLLTVCPCCGQKLSTKTSKKHMIAYMTGGK